MAGKGPLDTKIDTGALNEVIVFANQYRIDVSQKAQDIRRICASMEEEESLKGGDGDVIRENFAKIAVGCNNLDKSTQYIAKQLNERLGHAIEMRHGKSVAGSTDSINQATQKQGVFAKE